MFRSIFSGSAAYDSKDCGASCWLSGGVTPPIMAALGGAGSGRVPAARAAAAASALIPDGIGTRFGGRPPGNVRGGAVVASADDPMAPAAPLPPRVPSGVSFGSDGMSMDVPAEICAPSLLAAAASRSACSSSAWPAFGVGRVGLLGSCSVSSLALSLLLSSSRSCWLSVWLVSMNCADSCDSFEGILSSSPTGRALCLRLSAMTRDFLQLKSLVLP